MKDHERANLFTPDRGTLTDLNDLYWAHKSGREASVSMRLVPGRAVDFEFDTVVSAARGQEFESTGDPFNAVIRYIGDKAIKGSKETVYLVEDNQGNKFVATRESLHREGIWEGSDSDFDDEYTEVLEVQQIDADPGIN